MSAQKTRIPEEHPSPETLLLAIEGELAEGESLSVAEHLKICWECRTESEDLQNGIFAFMDYRKGVLPAMRVPPRQWGDFRRRLDRAAEECRGRSPMELARTQVRFVMDAVQSLLRAVFSGYVRPVRGPSVAVVIMVVLLIIYRSISSPIVSAQEFLLRASESGKTATRGIRNPIVHRKLRIRIGNRSITRDLLQGPGGRQLPLAAANIAASSSGTMQNDLQRLFLAHHLEWDDPLNAQRFAEWHDSLVTKQDTVNRSGAGADERIILNTATSSDPVIRDASLTVLARNWHPIEERLRLTDDTEIEIAELLFEVRNGAYDASPATTLLVAAPTPKLPGPPLAELAGIEVATRYALHQASADLGEPIQVVRSSGKVKVHGLVDTAARKAELEAVLQGIPHLAVEVQTPEEAVSNLPGRLGNASGVSIAVNRASSAAAARNKAAVSGEELPVSRDIVTTTRLPIQDFLEKCFAEERCTPLATVAERRGAPQQNLQDEIRQFSNRVVSVSDGALAEAWALRRIADHYQPNEVALLKGPSLQLLGALVRDHLSALERHVSSETTLVAPVLSRVRGPRPDDAGESPVQEPPARWPGGIYKIFRDVEVVQENTATLFAGSAQLSNTEVQTHVRELEAALARLSVALAQASQQPAELSPKTELSRRGER